MMESKITICCIDTTDRVGWSIRALKASAARLNFADVVLLTDAAHAQVCDIPASIRVVVIEPLRSIEKYSEFVLGALSEHFHTSHVLIVQWDGYVINADAWREDFLDYDYIGAVWPHEPAPFNVGNGGFSLRSRKLIDKWIDLGLPNGHPEDLFIGKIYREKLEENGILFAPPEVAEKFSVEEGSLQCKPFGFHGPFHFPIVLSNELMVEFLLEIDAKSVSAWYLGSLLRELAHCHRENRLDDEVHRAVREMLARTIDGLRNESCISSAATSFCKSLIRYGYLRTASALLATRREGGSDRWVDGRLWLRCQAQDLARRGLGQEIDAPVDVWHADQSSS